MRVSLEKDQLAITLFATELFLEGPLIQCKEGSDEISVAIESARTVLASNILVQTTLELENQLSDGKVNNS